MNTDRVVSALIEMARRSAHNRQPSVVVLRGGHGSGKSTAVRCALPKLYKLGWNGALNSSGLAQVWQLGLVLVLDDMSKIAPVLTESVMKLIKGTHNQPLFVVCTTTNDYNDELTRLANWVIDLELKDSNRPHRV